jgi:hypothetical protein
MIVREIMAGRMSGPARVLQGTGIINSSEAFSEVLRTSGDGIWCSSLKLRGSMAPNVSRYSCVTHQIHQREIALHHQYAFLVSFAA